MYVNITWVSYGAVHLALHIGAIHARDAPTIFGLMDVLSKGAITYAILSATKLREKSAGMQRALRMMRPHLEDAVRANLMSAKDLADLYDLLFSTDDLMRATSRIHRVVPVLGVMFVDVVGYSEMAAKGPLKDVVKFLDTFYTRLDLIVSARNAIKVETIGDAYMIVSERPHILFECARHIIQALHKRVRIGIHAGEAAQCTLGLLRVRETIVGHTVNVASRLESSGAPGAVHASEDALRCLDAEFDLLVTGPPLAPLVLKGVGTIRSRLVRFR